MLNNENSNRVYSCGICKTTPDQISHHKAHLETQKHKDKCELFELKLAQKTPVELEQTYRTINIQEIVKETETVLYSANGKAKLKHPVASIHELTTFPLDKQQTITRTKQEMMEQFNAVSNKEALKNLIHEIHNYMRNNGVGYGMNALKTFNLLYGLKKIEESGFIDRVNLERPVCEFSYLLRLANEDRGEKLISEIFGPVLDSIFASELKHLLYYEIPRNIRASVMVYLVKEINKITLIEKTCNVLLSGKIYEYFIGRDESAISELGAYFTDRHIVDFALEKLNPVLGPDGSVGTMIDPFGGSGGFTTGYINYMNQKFPKQICWETELAKISHFDMNEDVIKSAGLEFFCLTGVLPKPDQLFYKNSFADEFAHFKYKYPLTNPPYGGDKSSKTEAQTKREKIRDFIKCELQTITDEGLRIRRQKQLKEIEAQEKQEKKETDKSRVSLAMCSNRINMFAIQNGKLKGNDKESCSLILLMDILEEGGTALGVLKEGVFFNRQYMDLRKCLIEKYNVREVISIPQDQFENTSTKTSLLIFDNTPGKTTQEVRFSELTVERYTEDRFAEVMGDVVIVENKGDIKGVSDKLISTASRDEILQQAVCSLNGKDYVKRVINCNENYSLVNLKDLCDINLGTRITKGDNTEGGDIPVYGGGDITFYTNKTNRPKNTLIISRYALSKCCVRLLNTDFYLNDSGLSIHCKNGELQEFINHLLLSEYFQNFIYKNCTSGSIQKNINMNLFHKIQIPVPKSPEKIQEWVERISGPYNKRNECQGKIKELETSIQNKIKQIIENEECDEVELGSICDTKSGDYITKDNMVFGPYPVYGGGNISNYMNKYNRENELIINKDGVSLDCVKIESGKFFLNHHGWTLTHKDNGYKKYINYWLLNNKNVIYGLATGSAQKGINKEKFLKIKIKIPRNKQLVNDMEETHFKPIEKQQQDLKQADEQYKQLIQELSREAIPEQNPVYNEVNDAEVVVEPEPVNEIIQVIETKPVVIKKKTVKKVKLTEPVVK